MSAGETATAHGIGYEVAVTNLDHVGCHAAARAHAATRPVPTVGGDQSSLACAEGVVFAIADHDGRGIMDEWSSYLRVHIERCYREHHPKKNRLFHRVALFIQ